MMIKGIRWTLVPLALRGPARADTGGAEAEAKESGLRVCDNRRENRDRGPALEAVQVSSRRAEMVDGKRVREADVKRGWVCRRAGLRLACQRLCETAGLQPWERERLPLKIRNGKLSRGVPSIG